MHRLCLSSRLTAVLLALTILHAASSRGEITGQENGLPEGVKPSARLSSKGVRAYVLDQTLWLQLDSDAAKRSKVVIPRLCAPIRSFRWKDDPNAELKFVPEPQHWVFSWKASPAGTAVIQVEFDSAPVLPHDRPKAAPSGDGSVMLHAYQASTFGEKLRFEPQWYKNTIGYWTIDTDYASWELTIDQPGTYSVAVLQGCGEGQGGSDAVITLRQRGEVKAELPFQTIDTGHFQNFRWNHLGKVHVSDSGTHQLRIDAKRIANVALFDVRAIHLVRQAKSLE